MNCSQFFIRGQVRSVALSNQNCTIEILVKQLKTVQSEYLTVTQSAVVRRMMYRHNACMWH